MKREEILKGSREENQSGDEYQIQLKRNAYYKANFVITILLLIFQAMNYLKIKELLFSLENTNVRSV